MKFGIGQPVRRSEDVRFITGHGQYTDDITLPELLHAVMVRSPHAHARILNIDTAAALAMPGVRGVFTHDDIQAMGAGTMPCIAALPGRSGKPPAKTPKALLAGDRVRFVGEAIAMVVAETAGQARDAAEQVMVDYDPLPAAGTVEAAGSSEAIWDGAPGNLAFDWEDGDEAAVAAAFASAAHRVALPLVQNRIVANPMEPRAAIGSFDPAEAKFTLRTSSQGPVTMRNVIADALLKVPHEKLRVLTPDVGGGFGMKMFTYPEQTLVLFAAKALGVPVKWTGERAEAFLTDAAGRDMQSLAELALDAEGRILALRFTGTANFGGYLSQYAPFIPTAGGARVFGGVYRVPATYARVKCYFTNTAPVDAYRGAGRPEAAYFMERIMDLAAKACGVDALEIRRRNLVPAAAMPFQNWKGFTIDSGDFPALLQLAAERADWAGFAARKAQSKTAGKLRGRGVAYYVEITGGNPREAASIKFTPNGAVEVTVGTLSNGQGHETAFAQIVAEALGVPFESITIRQGDSDDAVKGGGTGGSRSLQMAGAAILTTAEQVIDKGKRAAAHLLEAAAGDIEFAVRDGAGAFRIAGTDRAMSIGEVALRARGVGEGFGEGLDTLASAKAEAGTFPNGCHICEVEIDPDTGVTRVVRYTVVDDFGKVVNPLLVAGQVHGGVAQGLGQALMENCVYDAASGQLVTGSFMDYAMPRADDMPPIDFSFTEAHPCTTNPLGVKGCGEAGTVGAMPALISAIADALKDHGVTHIDMPATPEKVWRAIHGGA